MSEQKFRLGRPERPDHRAKREIAQTPAAVPRGIIEVHCSPLYGGRLTSGPRIGLTIMDLKGPHVTFYS